MIGNDKADQLVKQATMNDTHCKELYISKKVLHILENNIKTNGTNIVE